MNIIQLLVSLAILVFIHELGHFVMARLFGTRVEKFYLFFNPWFSLFKWKSPRSGTVYGLGWLPLGGYCQIAGMIDEQLDAEAVAQPPKPDEFRSKKAWQRLLIMAGGIIFNLLLALFLYIAIAFSWGDHHLDSRQVSHGWSFSPVAEEVGFRDGDIVLSIDDDSQLNALDRRLVERMINAHQVTVLRDGAQVDIAIPSDMMQRLLRAETSFAHPRIPFIIDSVLSQSAQAAGLVPGAEVIAVADTPTPDAVEVRTALLSHSGQTTSLLVRLGDSVQTLSSVPVDADGMLGVVVRGVGQFYPVEQRHYGVLESISVGASKAASTIEGYVVSIKHIFTKEGAQSLGGLGTMAQLFSTGFDWQAFWATTAFLSIILAVMNLLPIPALDGGHIVLLLIEMITRRKLSDKAMIYIQTVGVVFLLLLMLYANGNDVYRYFFK